MSIDKVITAHLKQEVLVDRPEMQLTEGSNLIDEGVLDSLGIFLLINFLEEQFGVQIEADDVTLENFETVGTIAELVQAKRQSAA